MHEGHRQRMYAKLENGDDLYDHEILELLLYFVCPRVNTNPLAHKLLDRFCSISEIFKADAGEIKSVEGAGDTVARFLRTVGMCAERAGSVEGAVILKNYGDCKKFVGMRLHGKTEEYLELYFLDKSGRVKRILTYTSADRNRVVTNADEFVKHIALAKPHGILVAHNHLNNSANPSRNDEKFTAQVQLMCNMNNVKFWDHIIYSGGEYYSYRDDGKMQELERLFSVPNVMKWIDNTSLT